jgi:hypothetical protein
MVESQKKTTAKSSSVKAQAGSKQASKVKSKLDSYSRWKKLGLMLGIPLAFYFIFFWLYAGTWMGHFDTRFFADQGDGFQNVWNMWWVNFSVTHLHQLPWHTTYLHYPYGTSLVGQTLNPFNGFVAIILLKFLSLVQAYNTMVVFSFVFGGITAFWLCYFFTKKYVPSLIGGFIFTFSSYHFAHAIGHMQLVSLEWIPLFILLWWQLLTKPRYRTVVGSAVVLLLVLLCDYYYFLYCVGAAVLILIFLWRRKELADFKLRSNWRPWTVFLVLGAIILLPLPLKLLIDNHRDPLLGAHDARLFSTDLFSMVITGGFWHFASITHWYWRHVKAYIAESSVYFGISTLVLIAIAFWKRNKIHTYAVFWLTLGLIFVICSMGPRLMAIGHSINRAPLPYALLEKIIPPLKLSGDPDRFIVMAFLAASVLAAMVLAKLDLKKRRGQILTGLFFVVMAFEFWPAILPLNVASAYPKYVTALKSLPAGAVLDNGAVSASWQLYDQTITDRPMALGYISRVPTSVNNEDNELIGDVSPAGYAKLCTQFHIRYVTTPASRPLVATALIVYHDSSTLIYDLSSLGHC